MKRLLSAALLLILVAAFAGSCTGSRKSQCACPNRKGFVGY